jgi:hypothetical protein
MVEGRKEITRNKRKEAERKKGINNEVGGWEERE